MTSPFLRHRLDAGQKSAPWFIAGYSLLGLATLLLPPVPRGLGLNALNTAVFLHGGALCLGRARAEREAARGWRGIAMGLFAQAANQAWASAYMFRHRAAPPFPGWNDLCSVLTLVLIILSLLAWPLVTASGSERLRKGMDGLGAALSAFFVGWFVALGPLFHRSESSPAERGSLVVFFLGNAMVLGICAYLGMRQTSRFRGPLGWITLGFGVSLLQISLQVPLALAGRYHLGDPLDLLVLLVGLLILLAPMAPQPLEPGRQPGAEIRDASGAALLLPLLPAATALTFILAALTWAPGHLDAPGLVMAASLAGLGLLRGMLALRDLQDLSSGLERRVLERTQDLELMQQAMLRNERMNAMAVLGAGMAHDLNNALASVRACAELSLSRLEDGEVPSIKDLSHILVAADQSAALTRRLLRFGHQEEEPHGPLCLREELSHQEPLLRMLLGKGIALGLELGDSPVPILGSRAQIEQIFVNLVANARDAMPEGGTITIQLRRDVAAGRPIARVEVNDTGEGMTPEVQAKLFSPFFTTKGPGRGTGLGLASVRQLMHDMEGTLALASQPGRGTTFVLRFPLREA